VVSLARTSGAVVPVARQMARGDSAVRRWWSRRARFRAYAWSTDDLSCAELYAPKASCTAIQHDLSVFDDKPELLAICERNDLASVNRSPLAMGLVSGRFRRDTVLPGAARALSRGTAR
jgi:aryl-alcohol dehydrogenase-like predicted oxidoreductase